MSWPSVFRETTRTARKSRHCEACNVRIKSGDRYVDHFSVTDGDQFDTSFCVPCFELIGELRDAGVADDGLDFSGMWEEVGLLEDEPETRPVAIAWFARMGTPVRYVDDERFILHPSTTSTADWFTPAKIERTRPDGYDPDWLEFELPLTLTTTSTPEDQVARFMAMTDAEFRALVVAAEAECYP